MWNKFKQRWPSTVATYTPTTSLSTTATGLEPISMLCLLAHGSLSAKTMRPTETKTLFFNKGYSEAEPVPYRVMAQAVPVGTQMQTISTAIRAHKHARQTRPLLPAPRCKTMAAKAG